MIQGTQRIKLKTHVQCNAQWLTKCHRYD